MGEQYIRVEPIDDEHARRVIATAKEEGISVDGLAGGSLLLTVPGRYTGWDDLGRERRYRRLAGEQAEG